MKTNSQSSILIVDDDPDILLTAEIVLKKSFTLVITETDPKKISSLIKSNNFNVVLLDMNFISGVTSGDEGLHWLTRIRAQSPTTKVILMTAYGGMDLAIKALKQGATDFVVKPWDNAKLIATVSAAINHSKTAEEVTLLKKKQKYVNQFSGSSSKIIGESDELKEVLSSIDKVASTDANVLILGENGTGKELVARALHNKSNRAESPFINIDIGAITESLFESELFGYNKGAFTDARTERPGRFEVASGGTLFLDEIGNLNVQMQAKLLGVLESRKFNRLGSNQSIDLDVRLISATNMPLDEMIDAYRFRQDLLYRINTVEIRLPALRERPKDIPLLANHFLNIFSNKYAKPEIRLTPDTISKLQKYDWPGNIRELQHAIERAVIMAEENSLKPSNFVLEKPKNKSFDNTNLDLNTIEKSTIQKALIKHQGNLSKAATDLGLGRSTLYRKMEKYEI